MNYVAYEDYGGAIKNFGSLFCVNCTFSNNKGALGGAIYNVNAICHIENCTFINNKGYRHGNDIYNFDKVALTVNMTDCELYYDKPLPEWAKSLITLGVGLVVGVITAIVSVFIPPAVTWYMDALYGAIVGTIMGSVIIKIKIIQERSFNEEIILERIQSFHESIEEIADDLSEMILEDSLIF